jgi:hypothetical protein
MLHTKTYQITKHSNSLHNRQEELDIHLLKLYAGHTVIGLLMNVNRRFCMKPHG